MIEFNQLRCGYDARTALEPITFRTQKHLSILGPNGAGKSMLAKTMCGLLPFGGEIKINNCSLHEMGAAEVARSVAYVPSKLDLFDSYTDVREFILMGRYTHKHPFSDYGESDHTVVEATMKELDIADIATQNVLEISSGQQQLVLIAQAMVQQSACLIFDEPTANLDPLHTAAFFTHLTRLRESRSTVLITHDLHLARSIGGSVLFVHENRSRFFENANDFFEPAMLFSLYGVVFDPDSLSVRYA